MDEALGATPGEVLPGTKYRVVAKLGEGGMGVVYLVEKPPAIRGVLKMMNARLSALEEFRQRFLDEAKILALLDHPNVVRVFDYDVLPNGRPYFVMEQLSGRTLAEVLASREPLPMKKALVYGRELCEALHAAHTNDPPVVHRDVKPENIFLHRPKNGRGQPVLKLIDFGVMTPAYAQHADFMGTLFYAAPELLSGQGPATPKSDLYAAALVIYEMMAGRGPFDDLGDDQKVAEAHVYTRPPRLDVFCPWAPPALVELLDRCLAKEPAARPFDAASLAAELADLEPLADDRTDRLMVAHLSAGDDRDGGSPPPSDASPRAAGSMAPLATPTRLDREPRRKRAFRALPLVALGAAVGIAGPLFFVAGLGRLDAPAPAARAPVTAIATAPAPAAAEPPAATTAPAPASAPEPAPASAPEPVVPPPAPVVAGEATGAAKASAAASAPRTKHRPSRPRATRRAANAAPLPSLPQAPGEPKPAAEPKPHSEPKGPGESDPFDLDLDTP